MIDKDNTSHYQSYPLMWPDNPLTIQVGSANLEGNPPRKDVKGD